MKKIYEKDVCIVEHDMDNLITLIEMNCVEGELSVKQAKKYHITITEG